MRIISQDGRVDFPYDLVMVEIEPENKKDILLTTPEMAAMGQAYVVAEYSTPERAKDAMKLLHDAYLQNPKMTGKTKLYERAGNGYHTHELSVKRYKVFQFPIDSEV